MVKLSTSFTNFISQEYVNVSSKDYFNEIINVIKNDFSLDSLNTKLEELGIKNIEEIKFDSLDFLISYADFILKDSIISENEFIDFSFLKKIFKIKEGDFIQHKKFEINEILKKEFIRIYSDSFVDKKEELLKLNLQDFFDLSYDQFEDFKKDEIIISLLKGANPKDLDITKIPKDFKIV